MDAYIGEIRAFPYNFTPEGWLPCEGGYVSISQYQALYAIIGTAYGGDGRVSMQLPDLRGAACTGMGQMPGGNFYQWGYEGGSDHIYITHLTMPTHNHTLTGASVSGAGLISKLENEPTNTSYVSNVVVKTSATSGMPSKAYSNTTPANTTLAQESVSTTGQTMPHNNLQPSLVMTYFINYDGIWPPRP